MHDDERIWEAANLHPAMQRAFFSNFTSDPDVRDTYRTMLCLWLGRRAPRLRQLELIDWLCDDQYMRPQNTIDKVCRRYVHAAHGGAQ